MPSFLSEDMPCKSFAIGRLPTAHPERPIAFLYVICIILLYAPFALVSRAMFAQSLLGMCSESNTSSSVSSRGHTEANR